MKNIIKNTLILTTITLVAGVLLGLVYEITKEPIALAKEAAKRAAELAEKQKLEETAKLLGNLKKAGKAGLVIAGVSLASYGVYKAITYTMNKKDVEENQAPEVEDFSEERVKKTCK